MEEFQHEESEDPYQGSSSSAARIKSDVTRKLLDSHSLL
jgi:hypothetical protein